MYKIYIEYGGCRNKRIERIAEVEADAIIAIGKKVTFKRLNLADSNTIKIITNKIIWKVKYNSHIVPRHVLVLTH